MLTVMNVNESMRADFESLYNIGYLMILNDMIMLIVPQK